MKKTLKCALMLATALCLPSPAEATPILHQDVVFLIDDSGSVGTGGFQQEKDLVSDLISTVFPGYTRFSAVTFATTTNVLFDFLDDQDRSVLSTSIQNASYTGGSSATLSALQSAVGLFQNYSPDADPGHFLQRDIVLITDGNPFPISSQNPCSLTNPAAATLRNQLSSLGVRTTIVGVGEQFDPGTLNCLVEDPDSQIMPIELVSWVLANPDEEAIPLSFLSMNPPADPEVTPVPEPASLGLVGGVLLALAGNALARRRRHAGHNAEDQTKTAGPGLSPVA